MTAEQASTPTNHETRVDPGVWAARVAEIRAQLSEDRLPDALVLEMLSSLRFRDATGRYWSHSGTDWWLWDGTAWSSSVPAGHMLLEVPADAVAAVAGGEAASARGGSSTSQLGDAVVSEPVVAEPVLAEP